MSNEVILNNVSKAYGNNLVLNKLNLCVKDGELVSLLGSSGCGKTTALRIIAGFLTADTGRVMIGDTDCTYMPPNKRNTGMVFQSYALFPHMSVKENVGFGLKIQKTPSTEAALRIKEILMTTRLEEFADRYPRQLSGGQQQRPCSGWHRSGHRRRRIRLYQRTKRFRQIHALKSSGRT